MREKGDREGGNKKSAQERTNSKEKLIGNFKKVKRLAISL